MVGLLYIRTYHKIFVVVVYCSYLNISFGFILSFHVFYIRIKWKTSSDPSTKSPYGEVPQSLLPKTTEQQTGTHWRWNSRFYGPNIRFNVLFLRFLFVSRGSLRKRIPTTYCWWRTDDRRKVPVLSVAGSEVTFPRTLYVVNKVHRVTDRFLTLGNVVSSRCTWTTVY